LARFPRAWILGMGAAGISDAAGVGAILVTASPVALRGKTVDLIDWLPERSGEGSGPQVGLLPGKPALKYGRGAPGRSGARATGRDARDA